MHHWLLKCCGVVDLSHAVPLPWRSIHGEGSKTLRLRARVVRKVGEHACKKEWQAGMTPDICPGCHCGSCWKFQTASHTLTIQHQLIAIVVYFYYMYIVMLIYQYVSGWSLRYCLLHTRLLLPSIRK